MKLKRGEFNVLLPKASEASNGKGGPSPSITGAENLDPEEDDDDNSGGQDKQGQDQDQDQDDQNQGDGNGDNKSAKKDKYSVDIEKSGSGKDTGIIINENHPGEMMTPAESEALQRTLNVPVELPEPEDDKKMAQEARRHMDKLSTGEHGSGKGSLRRAVSRLTEPIVDWKSVLKRYIGKAMSSSELHLGSRRHIHSGDYFYGEKHKFDALAYAIVAVDTSGSMSPEAIELILSETKGIIKAKKIKHTDIVYFDDGIQSIDSVDGQRKVIDLRKAKGGGGTSFLEPIQYMDQMYKKDKCNLAVFMTDGYANLNLPIPKCKHVFVWVILDNSEFKAPFGNLVVHISRSQMKQK